jgi:hypothetical protein
MRRPSGSGEASGVSIRLHTRGPHVLLLAALAVSAVSLGGSAATASARSLPRKVRAPTPRVAMPEPDQLAVAPNGTVYVLDDQAHSIQLLSASGKLVRRWGPNPDFVSGTDAYNRMAVGPDGTVYLVSFQDILLYTSSGRLKARWHLGGIQSLAVTRTGTVYVFQWLHSPSPSGKPELVELSPKGTILRRIAAQSRERV